MIVNLYGIYQGGENPKKYWEKPNEKGEYPDDYQFEPIDNTDLNAKKHDLDFDKKGISGFSGTAGEKSTEANKDYIKRAETIQKKFKSKEKDEITGKPVTVEAFDNSLKGALLFIAIEKYKEIRNDE